MTVPSGDDGSGDAVLLLHGSTGTRLHWLQVTPELATRWRVLAPDFQDVDRSLEIDDLVEQAVGVLDAADVERAHVAGWSLGAAASAALAAARPERVRSLTLVSGWVRSDASMARVMWPAKWRLIHSLEALSRTTARTAQGRTPTAKRRFTFAP